MAAVGLLSRLKSALQHDKTNEKSMSDLSPDELGVDSLIAVDIQSWLRKELGVDLPLMKILNVDSIENLICLAHELYGIQTRAKDTVEDNLLLHDVDPKDTVILGHLGRHGATKIIEGKGPQFEVESTTDVRSSNTSSKGLCTPPSELELQEVEGTDSELLSCFSKSDRTTTRPKEIDTPSEDVIERRVPMSFAQSRFWFLKHLVEDQCAFNVTTVIRLRGKVDINRFIKAAQYVGQRHQAIRTAFHTDSDTKEHMQVVLKASTLSIEHSVLDGEDLVQNAIHQMQNTVFDLSKGDCLHIQLICLGDDTSVIILGYHHIVMDGIGNQIFLSDLEQAYHGTLDWTDQVILQYPDFTLRQREAYNNGLWADQLQFWHRQFTNFPAPLPLFSLSHKLKRPESLSFANTSASMRVDNDLRADIQRCCRQLQIRPFHFYLAVFRILLFRYSERKAEDLCIGVTDGNRKTGDVLRSLGLFLNLLPLRFRHHTNVDQQPSFDSVLKNVKTVSDNAFANSVVPFDVLLTELNVPRTASHTPLFQTLFNYRNNVQDARIFLGCEAEGKLVSGGQDPYDISVDVLDSRSRDVLVTLAVNSELYTEEDSQVILNSYVWLLRKFVANTEAKITDPPLYSEAAVQRAIEFGRGKSLRQDNECT